MYLNFFNENLQIKSYRVKKVIETLLKNIPKIQFKIILGIN